MPETSNVPAVPEDPVVADVPPPVVSVPDLVGALTSMTSKKQSGDDASNRRSLDPK